MKKMVMALLLLISTLGATEINWQKDFKTALYAATSEKKPMMFIVSSHNCKYCVILENETLSDPAVIEAVNRDFVSAIAYTDENPVFPQELYTGATPTIWFIDPLKGPMFQPIRGAIGKDDYLYALDYVMKTWNKDDVQAEQPAQ